MKVARVFSHLLFASVIAVAFVWLAPWRLVAPPPEAPRPQRLMGPTFHLWEPCKNDMQDSALQPSKPIDATMGPLNNDVGLFIVPGPPVPWSDQYMGRKVRLYNNTDETRAIPTVDSALYAIPEAMDRQGSWRALEDYVDGECMYSFFNVNLEPRHYWEFIVPIYEGSLQTRMRYVLSLGGERVAYSEEFEGSVSPDLLGIAWGVERMRPQPRPGFAKTRTTRPLRNRE